MQIFPIKRADGRWARSNEDKAHNFAEHLENIFQPHGVDESEITTEVVEQENEEIRLTTPTEVRNIIKSNIKPKKAPGYDLITGEVLKHLPMKALVKLTNLITQFSD